jgi:valyl-tRNA synthetase
MPFIAAEIWQTLHKLSAEQGAKSKDNGIIAESSLPVVAKSETLKQLQTIEKMSLIQEIVTKIRTIRSEMNVSPAVYVEAVFNSSSPAAFLLNNENGVPAEALVNNNLAVVQENKSYIKQLAKINKITFGNNASRPKNSALAVAGGFEIFLPLEGLIDIEKEKSRLAKEIAAANEEITRTTQKLSNENFIKRAPEAEIEKIKTRLNEARTKVEKIKENLKFLS